MAEPIPCPICGYEPEIITTSGEYLIQCPNRHDPHRYVFGLILENTILRWNTGDVMVEDI